MINHDLLRNFQELGASCSGIGLLSLVNLLGLRFGDLDLPLDPDLSLVPDLSLDP